MPADADLPGVSLSELDGVRYLHLGTEWVQGSMRIDAPFDIHLEYVQRMMAWLLFVSADEVPNLRAMQLGLGAAALTKFCHKKLRMHTTVVELNPGVVMACRGWFRLPQDGPRLQVLLANAAHAVHLPEWAGTVDALQVDLYDHEAAAPVLDSEDFYRACRRLLSAQGAMTVNLFGRSASYERSLSHITAAFGAGCVWAFKPTREGNTVVMGLRHPRQPARGELAAQAQIIEARWGLPATKWLRSFKLVDPSSSPNSDR